MKNGSKIRIRREEKTQIIFKTVTILRVWKLLKFVEVVENSNLYAFNEILGIVE